MPLPSFGVLKRIVEPEFIYEVTPQRRKEYLRSGTIHIPVEIRRFIEQNNPNKSNFDLTTYLTITVRIADGASIRHLLDAQREFQAQKGT